MRLTVVCLVAIATLAGCGGSSSPPGNPATYAHIEELNTCDSLQQVFDLSATTAGQIEDQGGDASIPHSYMDAANTRMEEMGC